MRLTGEEKRMLDGQYGKAVAMCMSIWTAPLWLDR